MPVANIVSFWAKLDELIQEGRLRASEEVLVELSRKEDDLYKWAKARRDQLVIKHEEDVQLALKDILDKHELIAKQLADRSFADPWVIAVAKARGWTVVTGEQYGGQRRPRIPDVCDSMSVPWIPGTEIIKREKWII